jgi:CheY-like chemotaxis protein
MGKVLIAYENSEYRDIIKKALLKIEKIDISNQDNVIEIENGVDIVPVIKSGDDFDYIIIDAHLSLLDGANAIQIMLDQGFLSNSKIIFLTQKALHHDVLNNKLVKGIMLKSEDIDSLSKRLESMLFSPFDLLSEGQQKLLLAKIGYQKKFIIDIILKYCAYHENLKDIKEEDFSKELDYCYEEPELVPQNDILPLIEEIIENVCQDKNIKIKISKHKLKFVFENRDDVDTKVESTPLTDKANLKNLLQNKDVEEQEKDRLIAELDKELERYEDILIRYENLISESGDFDKFCKVFSNQNIVNFHLFLIHILLEVLKDIDVTIETNKLKNCIKDAKIMIRGVEILEYLRYNAKFYDFEHEAYSKFLEERDKGFDLVNKFIQYKLSEILINEVKKSDDILNSFMGMEVNKVSIGTFFDFVFHSKDCTPNDFMKSEKGKSIIDSLKPLKSDLNKIKYNIIYLSHESVNESENLKYIQKITDSKFSTYDLSIFSKNSVFDIWTNNHKPVDILIVDDAYELQQEKDVSDIMRNNEELFSKTKIVLLTQSSKKSEDFKALISKASIFLKKPLDYEKTYKSILSI